MSYLSNLFKVSLISLLTIANLFYSNHTNAQYFVDFEGAGETKTGYALGPVNLSGLEWSLNEVLIGTAAADFKNGTRSLRMRGHGVSSATMTQDKAGGAGTISFLYSEYGTDSQVDWRVELSADQGETWTQVGAVFQATGGTENPETFEAVVDIAGDVRIRIVQTGDAGTSNQRLNIDDITITDFVPLGPAIGATPNLLQNFTQYLGQASLPQSLTVFATNLVSDLTITVTSGDYQISTSETGLFLTTLTLSPDVDGNIPSTPIFVRLNGASELEEALGTITLTADDADNVVVQLSGSINLLPETIIIDFEGDGETKTPYQAGIVSLSGFEWNLSEVAIGTLANDFKNGIRSARLRGRNEAVMEMIQDKPFGLGEISFVYRIFGADSDQQPWNVDYSVDGGITWENIGQVVGTADVQTFTETVAVPGDVRVRVIIASEPGETGDRRLNIDDISLTNYFPEPSIIVSETALTGFEQTLPNPSAALSFTVSGESLNELIGVVVSGEYEISLAETTGFTNTLVLNEVDGAVEETTIFVRLNASSTLETALGEITLMSAGAATQTVTLSGESFTIPELVATPNVLGGFMQIVGTPSDAQSFELSGEYLEGNVNLSVSGAYEISLEEDANFATSLALTNIVDGDLASTLIYVRLNGAAPANPANGAVTIASTSATSVTVNLAGQIQNPAGLPTITSTSEEIDGFLQVVGFVSEESTFQISATSLSEDLSLTVTGDYEISLTSEVDFAQSLTLSPVDEEVVLTTIYVRLNGANIDPNAVGEILLSSAGADDINILLSGEIVDVPVLFATPDELTGFSQTVGTPSNPESIQVAGVNLLEDLTIVASENYEISLDAGTGFTDVLTLSPVNQIVGPVQVFVRLNGASPLNPADGTLTLSSLFAEDFIVTLSGQVNPILPAISSSVSLLLGFEQTLPAPSQALSLTVSGEDLNEGILITASGAYEISLTEDEDFDTSLLLEDLDGAVASTMIYVRLNGTEAADPAQGQLVLSSLGADNIFVSLNGVILDAPVPTIASSVDILTGFEQIVGTPSAEQSFELSGFDLLGDVALVVNGDYEISLSADVDYASSLDLSAVDGALEVTTIYVRLNGAAATTSALGVITISAEDAADLEIELEGQIFEDCDIDLTITGGTENATVSEQAGATYVWLDCDNDFAVINGETANVFTPNAGFWNVAAQITIGNCVDTTSCVSVGTNATHEEVNAPTVQLYPNPMHNHFMVSLKGTNSARMTVYSALGNIVLDNIEVLDGSHISTADWSKGVYLVNLNYESGVSTIRIVKQ